jgi:hypothetical protein
MPGGAPTHHKPEPHQAKNEGPLATLLPRHLSCLPFGDAQDGATGQATAQRRAMRRATGTRRISAGPQIVPFFTARAEAGFKSFISHYGPIEQALLPYNRLEKVVAKKNRRSAIEFLLGCKRLMSHHVKW